MNKTNLIEAVTESITENLASAGLSNYDIVIRDNEISLLDPQNSIPNLKWEIEAKNYIGELPAIKLAKKINKCKLFVVAEKIEQVARRIFRAHGIGYLDNTGAIFLKANGILVFIETDRKNKTTDNNLKIAHGKAWAKLYLLLLGKPDAARWTVREISAAANLGLGTVSQLLNADKEQIRQMKAIPDTRNFGLMAETLEKWAEVYNLKAWDKNC